MSERITGTVKWFNGGKGYGFLPSEPKPNKPDFRACFEAGFRAGWNPEDFRRGLSNCP